MAISNHSSSYCFALNHIAGVVWSADFTCEPSLGGCASQCFLSNRYALLFLVFDLDTHCTSAASIGALYRLLCMRRRGTAPLALDGGGYGSEPQARRKAVFNGCFDGFLGWASDRSWRSALDERLFAVSSKVMLSFN